MKHPTETWACYQSGSNASGTAIWTSPGRTLVTGIDFAASASALVAADGDKPGWVTAWRGDVQPVWANGDLGPSFIGGVICSQRTNATFGYTSQMSKFLPLDLEMPNRGVIKIYFLSSVNQNIYSWTTIFFRRL